MCSDFSLKNSCAASLHGKFYHKNAHSMYGGDCDAAIAKAAAAVTHVQSQSQEVGSGDEGLGFLYLICHQQNRTFGGWNTSIRDFAYFRVSYDILRSSWKRSSPCVPTRRWLSLSSRAKAFTLQGRHRRFVADSVLHTSLRGALLLIGEQQKWYHQILQNVQNLMPHDYIPPCTVPGIYCCTAVCTC